MFLAETLLFSTRNLTFMADTLLFCIRNLIFLAETLQFSTRIIMFLAETLLFFHKEPAVTMLLPEPTCQASARKSISNPGSVARALPVFQRLAKRTKKRRG